MTDRTGVIGNKTDLYHIHTIKIAEHSDVKLTIINFLVL